MRTTVTLDPDTAQLIRRRMRERRQSFKQALNDAIRESATGTGERSGFTTETADLGAARIDVDRALQIAAALDDAATLERLAT